PGLGDRTVRLRGAAGLDRRAASGDARPAPRRPGGGGQGARRRRAGGDDGPPGGGAGRQGARPGERRDRRPAARSEARGLVLNLSEPFIRRPVMTAVLTVAVKLFGALRYRQLPVNDVPGDYPGASPETVASNIATPLERQFMQINGLELVTSKSTQGHVTLTLQFALDKSIDAAAT